MGYYAITIFLSAFLLFQVQPMIARTILPWFGGTSAVWSTSMLFFQVLLTGGYAYASWLTGSRRREVFHMVLVCLSVIIMIGLGFVWKSPITPGENWKPGTNSTPIWEIFRLLLLSVGLPYFLLSSNSPLIQAWFHRQYSEKGAYRLYAVSNIGSLIALITYPVVIEPTLTLAWQGRVWSGLYLVFSLLVILGVTGNRVTRSSGNLNALQVPGDAVSPQMGKQSSNLLRSILWVILAATASILLLATTSHITQEVAVIPFLWVLPLTLYLLSFVLAFSGERWYSRQVFLILFFISSILYAWVVRSEISVSIFVQLGIFSLLLFSACMICNGELYRLRPVPQKLTTFYFLVSVGGALGGVLVTFLVPFLFKGFWELPFGVALCWIVLLLLSFYSSTVQNNRFLRFINDIVLLSGVVFSIAISVQTIQSDLRDYSGTWRNFYGIVRIKEIGEENHPNHAYLLIHGITVHGKQFTDPSNQMVPTTYYGETSGVGLALRYSPIPQGGRRIGALGMGIGTVSAYGLHGDLFRFYEINPVVIDLAEGKGGYFSFLSDSAARVEIIPGDARLSLEKEITGGESLEYDLIILDVFSSDSIPVHLLCEEAFSLYLEAMKPGGLLAINITNRELDLVPVIWTLADHFGLNRALVSDPPMEGITSRSLWMLLSRDPSILSQPEIQSRAENMDGYTSRIRMWTDDYSNLFQILK